MSKLVTLSTNLDIQIKEALTKLCKKKGLKIQHFIESAIIEKLEDEVDLEAYHQRKNEETVSLASLLEGES
ncbi:MAG: hypothetical protein CME64_14665 [Halobacteriovoraceae bacterium]|nr:hypothetical protein [Halobacteriovoraceae bacterium]|tara:strand:- start:4540 stop:4752 length:213 start_codon:yes stop_codon:yes gene_type:complete